MTINASTSAGLVQSADTTGNLNIQSNGTTKLAVTSTGAAVAGTNTNDSAAAGYVGEYVSSYVSTYTNFPANGVFGDATSISLTAGDWDISYTLLAVRETATWSYVASFIGTASGNNTAGIEGGSNGNDFAFASTTTAILSFNQTIASWRTSLSGTTTYYMKVYAAYSAGQPQYKCRISARRVR